MHQLPDPHRMGPETSLEFFVRQMALTYWLDAISQDPKTLDFQGPTPPPTCPGNGYARIQNIVHGAV